MVRKRTKKRGRGMMRDSMSNMTDEVLATLPEDVTSNLS